MASYQYVYVMRRLTKIFPGGKKVLEDITLAFLPGAKIGVLGVNGAGKSTLLRIMAGLDHDFSGEAWRRTARAVGFLAQEPELDPKKDVLGNVKEAVAATKALLDRFDEVSAKFGDPDADMDTLLAEQAELQEQIDAVQRLGAGPHRSTSRWTRCAAARRRRTSTTLSGGERRRVALCRLLLQQPDMLLLDEPTNHLDAESVAWLERFLQEYTGHGRRGHARSLLPRQRRRLDSRARPRRTASPGRATTRRGSSRSRSGSPRRRRQEVSAPADARARARVGAHGARARARPRARRASPRTSDLLAEGRRSRGRAAPRS